ncbi:unnamed protein product [Blepharisma stoltei]|uniref:Mitochondrial import inner membrane translocase subunit n=1 Tax=Blepharisma stoltei TaxID=1481888 RepID=A0AAU9K0Z1_9CILI|nr:unnamed protein product [Blepharisma stoltei]
MDEETEQILTVQATVSKLSEHCFKTCDLDLYALHIADSQKVCIKSCVEQAFQAKNYIFERWKKEFPQAKKHNRSLEYSSTSDLAL